MGNKIVLVFPHSTLYILVSLPSIRMGNKIVLVFPHSTLEIVLSLPA